MDSVRCDQVLVDDNEASPLVATWRVDWKTTPIAIQKRAIHIIFNFARGMPYTSMLYAGNVSTLVSPRDDISQKIFQ